MLHDQAEKEHSGRSVFLWSEPTSKARFRKAVSDIKTVRASEVLFLFAGLELIGSGAQRVPRFALPPLAEAIRKGGFFIS